MENKQAPSVLISVLIYNQADEAIRTIECLSKQDYSDYKLLLIDNASSHECHQAVKQHFPELQLDRLSHNHGYAGGNNHALNMGLNEGYDFVLVCNHDIEVSSTFLSELVEGARCLPDCGVMGAVEVDGESQKIRAIGGSRFSFSLSRSSWLTRLPTDAQRTMEVKAVQGAALLFSRKALLQGVRLDEKLFLYCEEIDLGFQLKAKALKAYVSTASQVLHKSGCPLSPLQGYYIQRNRLYLSRKYATKGIYFLSILFMGLIELPFKTIVRAIQGYPKFSLACWRGFSDCLRGHMGRAVF